MRPEELRQKHYLETYLFDPRTYGRICVFVDFGNVRHWAKSFWPQDNKEYLVKEIDIEKLAEIIGFVQPIKKLFYYGHYAHHSEVAEHHMLNLRHRSSLFRVDKAAKCGFIKRTKEVKEIATFDEDGKYIGKISKCNFDVEMTLDALIEINNYDTIWLWSGDSDFHRLLQHLKIKRKKVIVTCTRDFMSGELDKESDLYIPADKFKEQLELVRNS